MTMTTTVPVPEYRRAEAWLNSTLPKCKKVDVDWTFEKYEFPDYVRKWVLETWVKVDDENGGTYTKPAMDATNQEARYVMANHGTDAAVKFMMTDQDTGRELSYSEMRARFG